MSARASTALCVALWLGAPSAHAEPVALDACVASHLDAQRQRKGGELRAARESLRVCSRPECPNMIVSDCGAWLLEVDRAIPTLVPSAREGEGRLLVNVRVWVDGKLAATRLDGAPIEVDPGRHRVRFEHAGQAIERELIVREGERARAVEVSFPAAKAAPPPVAPSAESASNPLGWVLLAAGVAGVGTSVFFGVRAFDRKADLDDRGCKPSCPKDEVEAGQRDLLIADIAGVVGLLGVGSGLYLVLDTSEESRAHGVGWAGRF